MPPRADHGGGWRPPRDPQYFAWHWLAIYALMIISAPYLAYLLYSIMMSWKVEVQPLILLRP